MVTMRLLISIFLLFVHSIHCLHLYALVIISYQGIEFERHCDLAERGQSQWQENSPLHHPLLWLVDSATSLRCSPLMCPSNYNISLFSREILQ